MSCIYCKNHIMKESTDNKLYNVNGVFISIRDIPCMECIQCGGKFFNYRVVHRVEEILNSISQLINDVTIIEYRSAA